MSLGMHFEKIVYEIFKLYNFSNLEKVTSIENTKYRADIVFSVNTKRYIVEIKYYRTKGLQEQLLRRAIDQLREYTQYSINYHPVLIVPNMLSEKDKDILKRQYSDVIFIGGNDLILSCTNNHLLSELKSVIDFDITPSILGKSISDIFNVSSIHLNNQNNDATSFIMELNEINPGKVDCYIYEKLCSDIINFLFGENIINKKTQKKTDDGLSRYDFIARISPKTAFWEFIVNEIGSRYVIFEFKNYQEEIRQGQILTTEKYLLSLALRKVAFIFCRKKASESANIMLRGALRESGKVIFIIDDEDLIKMLEMKESGSEPSDYLFQKADDLFMGLSR
ncbi:PD-(D/E)XK nuclease domain-containing protein [Actinobacillus genomosp. 1]|uniref:hypothetical protein n=1 Tax=Actinobacillus genomosp. 1 TaxID=254839 RepID=UPI0024432F36|nr:hypothetical protein [Actinobacillus genomosp. 1]WGE36659.1 PD-(D/E)XK nuclease domain-containing protein [Actinobacillus genomosp. 1]